MVSVQLDAALDRLEEALRGYGAPIVDAFRPGLDASYVSDVLRSEGLDPHPDALTWFGWHDAAEIAPPEHADDGTVIRYGGETVLVGPWWMLTLAQSLEYRRMHLQITRDSIELYGDVDEAVIAPESWLPIATSEGAGSCASTRQRPRPVLHPCTCSIRNRCMRERRSSSRRWPSSQPR